MIVWCGFMVCIKLGLNMFVSRPCFQDRLRTGCFRRRSFRAIFASR